MATHHQQLDCPSPAISQAIEKTRDALAKHRPGGDAGFLAYRLAYLVGTVRRCLAASNSDDFHRDLRLAAATEDYERRWSSSAVIAARFDLFAVDTRSFLAMLERQLAGRWSEDRRSNAA